MSDDRVQQVIDELDPTPAHEVDWPVSRRQTLRALAAAGLLGAGSGSASAESVGGVIADEAFLSNYGSESVSDGWELTIDDDVFALTESENTIGLPDGGVGEEVVLPSGAEASEMIAPDGTVVWEYPMPDSELYNEGDGEDDWQKKGGGGNFSKQDDHLRFDDVSAQDDVGAEYVGEETDLSYFDSIEIEWEELHDTENECGLIVAESVTLQGDERPEFTNGEEVRRDGGFSRTTDSVDIREIEDSSPSEIEIVPWVRDSSGTGRTTELRVYRIELFE